MSRAVRVLGVVAVVGVVLVALLVGFQRRLIYLPYPSDVPPAAEALDGAEDVVVRTADGLDLGAWYLPARGEAEAPAAVLVANGNAGHRGLRAPLAERLADEGLAVLLFDYRGFGGNPGSPSEEGLAADVRAAYRYLIDAGHEPDRVVAFGESIGGGVVAGLARTEELGGMVLRSPFVDLAQVGARHYPFLPVRTFLRDRFPVAGHVAATNVPVGVVYGSEDSIVPPEQSRRVAESAPQLIVATAVEGADHNDRVLLSGDPVIDTVLAVVAEVDDRP